MARHQIAYVELPCGDVAELKTFYGGLFGWGFQDWGPDYVALEGAGIDGGFNGEKASKPKAPLVIVETDEIEAMVQKVEAAGGTITKPLFAYPGGRRFHFLDPGGNELAVMQSGA